MQTIMFPINPELNDIIKTEHVCYYTKKEGDEISLFEIVKETWKHPECRELGTLVKYDHRFIAKSFITDNKFKAIVMLDCAEDFVKQTIQQLRI